MFHPSPSPLARRFKVNEPEELRALKASSEQASQLQDVDPEEIDDLLNELEVGNYLFILFIYLFFIF